MIPQGARDVVATLREGAMDDVLTVWMIEEDTSTAGAYDTTKTELYGPNASPHDGKASITEARSEIAKSERGDVRPDADAMARIPLVSGSLEEQLLDKRCEAAFRGRTKTGRITATERLDASVRLTIEWT